MADEPDPGTPPGGGTNRAARPPATAPAAVAPRAGWPVRLDSRRRPTLPEGLLTEARVERGSELVAHAEGEGRIVLETRDAVRRRLRQRFAEGRARVGHTGDPVAELLRERAADTSLDAPRAVNPDL